MPSAYGISPLFLIRLAGVSFDAVEQLATPAAAEAARAFIKCDEAFALARSAAAEFVKRRDSGLSSEQFSAWKRALQRDASPDDSLNDEVIVAYLAALKSRRAATDRLEHELAAGLVKARTNLYRASREFLPSYFVFASRDVHHLLPGDDDAARDTRNSRLREREGHLLLYLQRIAAKNDTFSRWGPSSWGRAAAGVSGLQFTSTLNIARRTVFFERWVAHALAGAINSDGQVRVETTPRLHPHAVLHDEKVVFTDSGNTINLSSDEARIAAQCDGQRPFHALDGCGEILSELVAKGVVVAAVEVPAMEPLAFAELASAVDKWRDGSARQRWQPILTSLDSSLVEFEGAPLGRRQEIVDATCSLLTGLGTTRQPGRRSLYAAINPIAEECACETGFTINETLLHEVARDVELWIDLWRDTFAFVASRVNAGLAKILQQGSKQDVAVPLAVFLSMCETARLPLTGPGLVGLAVMAFREVKAAFRAQFQSHANETEYELTAEDCHLVRNRFKYEKFDEFTYPSADLQLAAASPEAITRGEYQWIVSELHPPAALLHHCMFWSCPDQQSLGRTIASLAGRSFHFGFFAADFTAHTTVRAFDAMPELMTFVAPQRGQPHWRSVPPGKAEVFVRPEDGDVRLRSVADGEDLGSFARNWIIPLGFHPFQFSLSPQTPRLRCGRTIVQRRSWIVGAAELGDGCSPGASGELVVAVERLRARKGWPRFIYIRPSEQSLARAGAEGRDKDTKPVFVDLESCLSLEIFQRWLNKSSELEITEMLPAPDQLCWHDKDGRHTFELRTLVVPHS